MNIPLISCKYHPNAKLKENFYSVVCCECGLVVIDHLIGWQGIGIDLSDRPVVYQNMLDCPQYFYDDRNVKSLMSYYEIKNVYPQKFLKIIIEEANKIVSKLNLSKSIMKNILSILRQICIFEEIRNCKKEAIIYSCVFIACKKESIPFSFKDVCAFSTITRQLIGKTFKKIMRRLIDKSNNLSVKQIIEEMCEKLGFGGDVINLSYVIVTKAIMLDIAASHSPISIIAAAILLAVSSSGKKIDITETEKRLCLSESSLQETYDSFSVHLKRLSPLNS